MEQKILSVTQINEYIRGKLESDLLLSSVAVRGEISNYKLYPSGHHYFVIKDESCALKCVMFKGSAFSLRFRPENGMKVVAMGKISVYPRDGVYQMYCSALIPDGVGDLHAAFEQLKAKLEKQGLFDPAHKKPIPQYPRVIGVVTSGVGAAVQDILRILNKRYPLALVRVFSVRVQGVEAPQEIVDAISYANHFNLADLLIVGRGGGSMEDLWCFNDEGVARAIYDSEIPVISAVGHEPDVTIADYVADLRAATPSNGAELAVPDKNAIFQALDHYEERMVNSISGKLQGYRKQWTALSGSQVLVSPLGYFQKQRQREEMLTNRLVAVERGILSGNLRRFSTVAGKLDALSPLKVLSRGYSLAEDEQGNLVRTVRQVSNGEQLKITLHDGEILSTVNQIKENQNGTEEHEL